MIAGFPRPITKPFSDRTSLEGKDSKGNQKQVDRARRIFPCAWNKQHVWGGRFLTLL